MRASSSCTLDPEERFSATRWLKCQYHEVTNYQNRPKYTWEEGENQEFKSTLAPWFEYLRANIKELEI